MNEIDLDDYLRTYRVETNREPSRLLVDKILAAPDLAKDFSGSLVWLNPWRWFDMALPKAVGWALTCFLGVYLGLTSAEQGVTSGDETYYMYDQAQFILYEDIMTESSSGEEISQ